MFSYIRHSFLHLHNIISPFGQFVKFCVYISILTPSILTPVTINESTYDYEIFTPDKIHNIPVLNNGLKTGTYTYLNNIAHEVSTETYILNET